MLRTGSFVGSTAVLALVLVVASGALTAFVGCSSEEYVEPTRLREDYETLDNLVGIIDGTARELGDSMAGGAWNEAGEFAANLGVYARDLRGFQPENRNYADVVRFDRIVETIMARVESAKYYARLHLSILGQRECQRIITEVDALEGYLGPVGYYEGGHYEGRPSVNDVRRFDAPAADVD